MPLTVVISTVDDGSMLNRDDHLDVHVIENRRTYLASLGIKMNQTTRVNPATKTRALVLHETNWLQYVTATLQQKSNGMENDDVTIADALITRDFNHALMLPIADCVGAAIYDPRHNVLAVAHLGRHSLEQHGGEAIIHHLAEHYESNPGELQLWLTPAPSKDSYPIWALDHKGMKEATFEQLLAAGVLRSNITDNPAETNIDERYFSYSEFLKGHRTEDGDYAIVAMMTK